MSLSDMKHAFNVLHEQEAAGVRALTNVAREMPLALLRAENIVLRRKVRAMKWLVAFNSACMVAYTLWQVLS